MQPTQAGEAWLTYTENCVIIGVLCDKAHLKDIDKELHPTEDGMSSFRWLSARLQSPGGGGGGGGGGGALRVKISRGAPPEVQNVTQQDLNEMINLVNFWGKKIVYMLKMGGFEMGPNKIWIKW